MFPTFWHVDAVQILTRHTILERSRTACKPLGLLWLRTLTIPHGRYTFTSRAPAGKPDSC